MAKPKIIFVGSHPDDLEIGCGGTIPLFVQAGFIVICVFLTRGGRGGDPQVRERESREACRLLGVRDENMFFGVFEDTAVRDDWPTVAFLEQFIDDSVWAVFTHSVNETHQDHRYCAQACDAACRRVPRLLAYESPSSRGFRPNAFVRINGHLDKKRAALNCHASQIAQGRMYLHYESMLQLALFRGQQNNVDYAEAFEAIRMRIDPGWVNGAEPPVLSEALTVP